MTTPAPVARKDEGSLIMAILFTIILGALTLAIVATVVTSLNKSQNSREYSIAQQGADVAIAHALMHANLGTFNNRVPDTTLTKQGDVGTIHWSWTATNFNPANPGAANDPNNWFLRVHADGESVAREFRANIIGTRVVKGLVPDQDNNHQRDPDTAMRYHVTEAEVFGNGFFGINGWNASAAADVDGYNGRYGTVGSNQILGLGSSTVDKVTLWNWKPATDTVASRCTGTACATASRYPQAHSVNGGAPLAAKCTGTPAAWASSSGSPLENGKCYSSLTFNTNYTQPAPGLTDYVYVTNTVVVSPGITVNASATNSMPASKGLRIASPGAANFTLGAGALFAGAMFTDNGTCTVNPTNGTTPTWFGAATCGQFTVSGKARLRYDGG